MTQQSAVQADGQVSAVRPANSSLALTCSTTSLGLTLRAAAARRRPAAILVLCSGLIVRRDFSCTSITSVMIVTLSDSLTEGVGVIAMDLCVELAHLISRLHVT